MNTWAKMPSSWIRDKEILGLKKFAIQNTGSSIAALLIYIAFVHDVNDKNRNNDADNDTTELTYVDLMDVTNLSRALISRGIKKLEQDGLIQISRNGKKNIYKLVNTFTDNRWGKLPISHIVDNGILKKFTHRNKNELNALKMYLLFIALRDHKRNFAFIAYPKITGYSGVPTHHIRAGLSLLVNLNLIHIDRNKEVEGNKGNPPSQYRICGIDPYRHRGTQREQFLPDEDITLDSLLKEQ